MFVRKSKYRLLEARFQNEQSEKCYFESGVQYRDERITQLKRQIDDLKATVAAREAMIVKLEAKDIKIVNEQSKQFIEVEHASIKAMNEALPKLRRQGWSDKLKVKIQGMKVYTVHEREVKEGK
ncbi:hypothetical protein BCP78_0132 [Bacillus phage BCP78]|uniref:Uncharacterized protein n=3 Tax=Tsarbombavirus BCP78 TaxID=1985182 RepID=J9PQN4_9CAUD|nr:hypothetical protein BCP78_0132 [Bacillus phage BCP78]YP_009783495.1 hypothetical protein QLX27_gp122 [Bacillus phage BCU4]AEW47139.1 hypothetical protein BCP78_0132 [Bacillus phage BCP78]AEW47628.1 hypothetical protein BCU4_0122 [Bacillus phage BCU4]AQN32511.1 hypothetical protein BCP12_093 [Bacillus phage BCP12]